MGDGFIPVPSRKGSSTMTRVIGTFWALLGAFLTFKVYA